MAVAARYAFPNALSEASARRLRQHLQGCLEGETPLGPRGHHIRAISAVIESTLQELDAALNRLQGGFPPAIVEQFLDASGISHFIERAHALSALAREYPVGEK